MLLLISLVLVSTTLFYFYLKRRFTYWKDRGVPILNPNVIFGDITDSFLIRKHLSVAVQEFYNIFKNRGYKYGGLYFFGRPIFLPIDPNLCKHILVKDFDHFMDRGMYCDPENDPLSGHIFSLPGDEWKLIRQKLTPSYTSGKLKAMFSVIEQHVNRLCIVLNKFCGKDQEFVKIFERLGIDIIGDIAFGLDCNTLESKNDDFYKMIYKIFNPNKLELIKLLISEGGFTNPGSLTKLITCDKEVCNFFEGMVKDTISHRIKNKIRRNDFLQILIDLMGTEANSLTFNQIAAQSFVFFIAAFETSSKSLNYTMYELAKDKELQNDVRMEVQKHLEDNKGVITYDFVMGNKLLDMIFKESMRKFPPVPILNRECTKDYQIPNSKVILEKGTILIFSVLGMHRDPELFPNPDTFDPQRFNPSNQENIKPYTYLPFGEGPRICIGNRFAMMQVKLSISKLLLNFEFSLGKNTPNELEIKPLTENLLLNMKNKIEYNIKRIK